MNSASNPRPILAPPARPGGAGGDDRLPRLCGGAGGPDLPGHAGAACLVAAGAGAFREAVWDLFAVPGEKGARLFVPEPGMSEARFFPDARPNYAEGDSGTKRNGSKQSGLGRSPSSPGRTWSGVRSRGPCGASGCD